MAYKKGESGNPGGRPKGAPTLIFSIRQLYAQALEPTDIQRKAVLMLQENLTSKKTVVMAAESAARINKEIGLGSGDQVAGVTIIVNSPIRSERLR